MEAHTRSQGQDPGQLHTRYVLYYSCCINTLTMVYFLILPKYTGFLSAFQWKVKFGGTFKKGSRPGLLPVIPGLALQSHQLSVLAHWCSEGHVVVGPKSRAWHVL